jgi:2-polyprenyl-3-methyl-5-hydroxy-6-metoxy-1,4-benzoquinol methylase
MDNNLVEISCVICQSDDYETLFKEGKDGVPINFSICKSCGLTYLNPRWTKEAYSKYYANEYDGVYRSDVLKPEIDSGKYTTAKQMVSRLNLEGQLPNNPKRILDIGSGMGWSSVYLKDEVFTDAVFFAVESSLHCIENLKNNGISLLSDDIDSDWDQGSEKFDLIIMRHVLEHFLDPIAVLKKVQNLLSEKGVLYLAVPNNNNPYTPLKTNFLRIVHTFYFDPASIGNALKLAGINLVQLKELDKDNPYELYCICKKGIPRQVEIDSNNYNQVKSFFTRRAQQESTFIGKASRVAKRKWRKMFG